MANDSTRNPRLPTYFSAMDKSRLREHAPSFYITVSLNDDNTVTLVLGGELKTQTSVTLPEERAYRRLVNEICSKVTPWLYLHSREDSKTTLLKQTDAKLTRLAELYTLSLTGKHLEK